MFFVFGAPLYLSLGNSLGGSALYFLLAPIVGFAFLTPAILLGEMVAIVFAALLPADYGKWLFAGLFVIALFSFFSILSSEPRAPGYLPSGSLQASASLLLHYQSAPAQWAGFSIEALLQGNLGPTLPTIATSLAVSLLVWSCVVALFNTLFTRTVSMLQTKRSPWQFESRRRGIFSDIFLATTNQTRRALVTKEFFSFSREATHTVQLLLLLTICVLYLYNFSRIEPPTRVGPEVLRVWDIFLILANLVLGSMVLLSICSRFVFPSISLEGGAFWILQTAPLSVRHILRAKYFAWCIPTTLFSLVIFTSGGCALGLEPILIATTTVAGTIICHGLVALGIGMGARFARFDWTHSAQLTTNSGSFLYMLIGMLLVAINILPLTVVFGGYILLPGVFRDHSATLVLFASGIGALLLINVITGYIALRIGARALRVQ
jgi:ABC-2 type transport system permease protein